MFGLRRHDKNTSYGALIDVGSGSVGVGIVRSNADAKLPEIIFTHRVPMCISSESPDQANQVRRMREALFSASLVLSKEGVERLRTQAKNARISRILVTASSPWAQTLTREIAYNHDTDIRIQESLIEDLIKSAEDAIGEEVAKIEGNSDDLQVVERATVDLKANGYSITQPAGQYVKEISLSHVVGLLPKEILDAAAEVQEKIFTGTRISAHTYLLVIYCVLRDLFPKNHDFTILDITGESTEIGIVHNDVLIEGAHTGFGYHTLVRKISQNGGSQQDVLSKLRALSEGTAPQDDVNALSGALEQFSAALRTSIAAVKARRSIPPRLVITAPPQFYKLFGKIAEDTISDVIQAPCTIIEMQGKIMHEVAEGENQDVFISIAARFFHKLHGCGELEAR